MAGAACVGERCWCGQPAAKKVGEEILFDDPNPRRHNLTAYVCAEHYAQMMGPLGAQQVGVEALSRKSEPTVSDAMIEAGWQATWRTSAPDTIRSPKRRSAQSTSPCKVRVRRIATMADLTDLAGRLEKKAAELRRNAAPGFNGDESRGAAKALEELVEEIRACEKEEGTQRG